MLTAVETEISANHSAANGVDGQRAVATGNRSDNPSDQPPNGSSNGTHQNVRNATTSRMRAIHAVANRCRADLPSLLSSQFGVGRPDDLSIGDASSLIDQLKGTTNEAVSFSETGLVQYDRKR